MLWGQQLCIMPARVCASRKLLSLWQTLRESRWCRGPSRATVTATDHTGWEPPSMAVKPVSLRKSSGSRPGAGKRVQNKVDVTNESWNACFGLFSRVLAGYAFEDSQS